MTHANRGVEWERILGGPGGWHDTYRRDRRAVVFRLTPPVRVLSRVGANGQFRACYAGKGPPDFAGILDGGMPVVFDAKDCEGIRWSLGDLAEHQAMDLEAATDRGALAFVALRFGAAEEGGGRGWVLPWPELGPRWWSWFDGRAKRGEASISEGQLGTPMPEFGDWLGALRP